MEGPIQVAQLPQCACSDSHLEAGHQGDAWCCCCCLQAMARAEKITTRVGSQGSRKQSKLALKSMY